KSPRTRLAACISAGEKGGMQEREKTRWSLPLRNDGCWPVDSPRPGSATLLPFIRKSPPPGRIKSAEKARS
ncbi:hypothetical protein, partial [Mesorhizobium sp.]|uniref:hypothetical protein n=1 Tax=Mesorhizobium sp. TaxID=1871066 RepID=UPI00258A1776